MYHYLFTNDLRISNLSESLVKAGKCFSTNTVPSANENKSENNFMNTLGFYFNLTKDSNCAKLCADGNTRIVVLNFIKKFQFPNPRTTESMTDSVNDNITLAPMRLIMQMLYNMRMLCPDEAKLSVKEIADFIFYNADVAKTKTPDIHKVITQVIEYRKNGTMPGSIETNQDERIWKHEERQIRHMIEILSFSGCAKVNSENEIFIDHDNLSVDEKSMIFDIITFSDFWIPPVGANANTAKVGYQGYMDIDENELKKSEEQTTSGIEDGVKYAWYVGACGYNEDDVWTDFLETYIEEGRWENGWEDKFIEEVKSMKPGDRIAIKAAYTKKKNLPFNNNDKTVGVMGIKAIGVITENLNDGQNIKVDWQPVTPTKEWFGYGVLRQAVHYVNAEDGHIKKSLLNFTFGNGKQDYSICEDQYADSLNSEDEPNTQDDNSNLSLEELGKILKDMCDEGEKEGKKVAAIYNFGLLYGKIINEKYKATDIVKMAGIDQSFDRELQKAIKLYTTIEHEDFGLGFVSDHEISRVFEEKACEDEEPIVEYNKEQFLQDVFMDEDEYETLKQILTYKRNIILQGSPGVGKTYLAKRFAYSLMNKTDSSRVKLVQFHQNYSYEDFIMGYKPDGEGFKLVDGVFFEFCQKAERDGGDHYFIIDEINRGNVSKIFGELMMLIENDKRGVEKLRLAYKDVLFTVPKNVYILGMMNTADRSLAIMDYALRRRFSFYEVEPAFGKDNFMNHLKANGVTEPMIKKINDNFVALNNYIADEKNSGLGSGFRIGHSYFCTKPNCEEDKWYENIVKFEIQPMLEEYWFDEKDKVGEWMEKIK